MTTVPPQLESERELSSLAKSRFGKLPPEIIVHHLMGIEPACCEESD